MKLSILTLLASLAMATTTFARINYTPGDKEKKQTKIVAEITKDSPSPSPNNNTSKANCSAKADLDINAKSNPQIALNKTNSLDANATK